MDTNAAIIPFGLTAKQYETISVLFSEYLPSVPVWVYGSRITGKHRRNSDFDAVVFASRQNSQVGKLREAFDESNLPFRVDLHIWDELPESFHENIQNNYRTL
jgi:predicted nucleotidyltransferase